jgi:hypothetical protein
MRQALDIKDSLERLSWATVATEESAHRLYITAVVADGKFSELDSAIEILFCRKYLNDIKFDFLQNRIKGFEASFPMVALMSAMLHFDADIESSMIISAIRDCGDYDFDAIFNFRLKELKENWRDLSALAGNLLEVAENEEDITSATDFVLSGVKAKGNKLLIYKINKDIKIKDITNGREVRAAELYSSINYDILNAIIGARPSKVTVEGVELPHAMLAVMRRFCGVKITNF